MKVVLQPDQMRLLVCETLQRVGAQIDSARQLEETVLVREGRCVARSYRTADHFAMWLIELGLVQFYNGDGDIVLVLNLLHEATPGKMAA